MKMFSPLVSVALGLALTLASTVARAAGDGVSLRFHDTRAEGWTLQGMADDRWEWSQGGGLDLASDSTKPSARLIAPLPFTLDGSQNFRVEMDLVLDELVASPDDFFQVSVGLVSATTTGLNRTGTSLPVAPFFVDDADVFDAVELAYFPNVTFFGGPFLQPTVFGRAAGPSAFWNFAANFGPSSDLGDNTGDEARELPQRTPLRFVMEHDACTAKLTTRIFDVSGKAPREIATGIEPLDLNLVNAIGTFSVDAFAVSAYFDAADFDPSTPSLRARIHVERAAIMRRLPLEARLAPTAINADAKGGAHVIVSNAPTDGAVVRLVDVNGLATDQVLEAHDAGSGRLLVSVARTVAAAPFAIEVGGCRLDLAPERVVGP